MNLQERIDKEAERVLDKDLQDWAFVLSNLRVGDLAQFFTADDDGENISNINISNPKQSWDADYFFMTRVKKHIKER